MSPRLRSTGLRALLCAFALSAHLAFAQSQWKEIPIGYNMPKSVMAAAPVSAMAAASIPFPQAPKTRYAGEGRDMNRPWEVEFHGGAFMHWGGEGGRGFTVPTAATFTSFGGIGPPSQQVSSYFFGPGASLYNQFAPAFGFSNVITPLDAVIDNQLGKRNNGASLGVRLSRDFGERFAIELSADWNTSSIEIHDNQLLAIENARTSFANSFTEVTTVLGGPPASAISSVKRSAGSQLFWTGVVNVNLMTTGKTIPYLSFGGGGVSNLGPGPHAALLGSYSFEGIFGPHAESDLVNLQARAPRTQGVAVLGIGVKYYATDRWGIRFDFRDHVVPNAIDTVLFANPQVATLSPPGAVALIGGGNNNLVFSNDPSLGPSTLSGPAIQGIRTFRGDGITNELALTGGIFYRF